jgi:predicted lactoylglutathione lyase
MLDHIGLTVTNFENSKQFYKSALSAINYKILMEYTFDQTGTSNFVGFGNGGSAIPDFWLSSININKPQSTYTHIAFKAINRSQVDLFWKKALAAGGKDNGAPGLRLEYHPNYYAAFIVDPDGHNLEVVCHDAV